MELRVYYITIAALGVSYTTVGKSIAQPAWSIETETGTHLVDRGETLTHDYIRLNAAFEIQNNNSRAFIALNRLAPIGQNANEFGDELEVAVGAGYETRDWAWEATIARIEDPEDSSSFAYEAAITASLTTAFAPEVSTFYDFETHDYGLEAQLTINSCWFGLDTAIQPKAGFVGNDSGGDRSYAGLGVTITRKLTSHLQMEAFAASHISDQDSLIERIDDSNTFLSKDSGTSLGLRLVIQH